MCSIGGHDPVPRSRQATVAMVRVIALLLSGVTLVTATSAGQKKDAKQTETTRITLEVTGGDEKKPVADASVYLKYAVAKRIKDQKLELNLKTNQDGVTHSPEIPQGKVLIQIVAPGWKTFGEYYDLEEEEQTIQIHLDRPAARWY
jgi:hypothetical protein